MAEELVTPGDLVGNCENCGIVVEAGITPGACVAEYICDECGEKVKEVKVVREPRTVDVA